MDCPDTIFEDIIWDAPFPTSPQWKLLKLVSEVALAICLFIRLRACLPYLSQ